MAIKSLFLVITALLNCKQFVRKGHYPPLQCSEVIVVVLLVGESRTVVWARSELVVVIVRALDALLVRVLPA